MRDVNPTPHLPKGMVGLSNFETKYFVAFTDESYSGALYVQGAYVINKEFLSLIEKEFQRSHDYAAAFGISNDVEFHGHSIMSSRKGWESLNNRFRAKIAIYQNTLQNIAEIPGKLIFQELKISPKTDPHTFSSDPHKSTFRALLHQLNSFSQSEGCSITIYADHLTREKELLTLFDYLKNDRKLLPFISNIEHVDSKLHPGVQIADLCSYIYRRYRENNERDPRTRRAVETLWKIIEPKALKAPK